MHSSANAVRLQKVLAEAGLASRRGAEEMIRSKRVRVDGAVVDKVGIKVDPISQVIEVDGERIHPKLKKYYVMNKPKGYLTTLSDPYGRPTIKGLLPNDVRLFPVGRLDLMSEGLLIITNDGELANRLMHPKGKVDKVYEVEVKGAVDKEAAKRLEEGVAIEGRMTAPAKITVLNKSGSKFKVTIHEGRKRQIRLMFESIGHEVIFLKRVAYGPLKIGDLMSGKIRPLESSEVSALKEAAGLS